MTIIGAQFVPIGIPTICWYTMQSNYTYIFSMRKVKASLNSVQVQHLYESYFLLEKNSTLSEGKSKIGRDQGPGGVRPVNPVAYLLLRPLGIRV